MKKIHLDDSAITKRKNRKFVMLEKRSQKRQLIKQINDRISGT
jgi:signal recognition particle subunit SEC65